MHVPGSTCNICSQQQPLLLSILLYQWQGQQQSSARSLSQSPAPNQWARNKSVAGQPKPTALVSELKKPRLKFESRFWPALNVRATDDSHDCLMTHSNSTRLLPLLLRPLPNLSFSRRNRCFTMLSLFSLVQLFTHPIPNGSDKQPNTRSGPLTFLYRWRGAGSGFKGTFIRPRFSSPVSQS